MDYVIENCSSPGAQFSKSTNQVILKINEWIKNNKQPNLLFNEFRKRVEKEAEINGNNARNIYPLLKNGGLINYQPKEILKTESFFTRRGLAYINALQLKSLIENSDYSELQKEKANIEVDRMLENMICDSIQQLLGNKELNYSETLRWYLLFLSTFGKINKKEFAVMVYYMTNHKNIWKDKISPLIEKYRDNEIDFKIKVRVKNDRKIQQRTGEKTRLEDISFFTAYSYYSSLVDQAGLTKKIKDYHMIIDEAKEKIDFLLEV